MYVSLLLMLQSDLLMYKSFVTWDYGQLGCRYSVVMLGCYIINWCKCCMAQVRGLMVFSILEVIITTNRRGKAKEDLKEKNMAKLMIQTNFR